MSSSVTFAVLYRDDDLIVIDKPPGFHVHQPEDPRRRVPREKVILHQLRDQIGSYVFPVHRLDVGTSGVMVFALNKTAASKLSSAFKNAQVNKVYFALVRGWPEDSGKIEIPLPLDSTDTPVAAVTNFRTITRFELPHAVGKRHASARYALVEAHPETGRFHQVRRHFARLSHPLIGDRAHGDSHHNRFFRQELQLGGLWLIAKQLRFKQPSSGAGLNVECAWPTNWQRLFLELARGTV